METVTVEVVIDAPREDCFDAARDLDLHMRSQAHAGEQAVAGRTSGLIELGEEVTWRARHFGIVQHFTSKITGFDRPRWFQDSMQRGAFKSFVHDHFFHERNGSTLMVDELAFAAPLWIFGTIAEKLLLRRYMTKLLRDRALAIKKWVERERLTR